MKSKSYRRFANGNRVDRHRKHLQIELVVFISKEKLIFVSAFGKVIIGHLCKFYCGHNFLMQNEMAV